MAFLLSLEGVQRRDLDTGAKLLAALFEPVLMRGARPVWDQVQQPCRGMILPSRQVDDAGELTGPSSASVLVTPYVLINPQYLHACEAGGVQMRLGRGGLIWDHTVFHVVASCRANPAMVAPSKRNCRIAQRIARTPKRARGAHTRSSCSWNVTVSQACSRHIHRRLNHRNLAGTPAQGASITSTTIRPWP